MAILERIETRANPATNEYTRVFLVDLDQTNGEGSYANARAAALQPGIPVKDEAYPEDTDSVVWSVEAEPYDKNEDNRWKVTVEYRPPDDDNGGGGGGGETPVDNNIAPWNRGETLTVAPGSLTLPAERNYFEGNDSKAKIQNTAGQTIGIAWGVKEPVIKITATESFTSFAIQAEAALVGRINSGPVTFDGDTFGPLEVLYEGFNASQQSWTDAGGVQTDYWTVSRVYVARPDKWQLDVLNEGTVEVDTITGEGATAKITSKAIKYKQITVTERIPLKENGKVFRVDNKEDQKSKIYRSPAASELYYFKIQPYKTGLIR